VCCNAGAGTCRRVLCSGLNTSLSRLRAPCSLRMRCVSLKSNPPSKICARLMRFAFSAPPTAPTEMRLCSSYHTVHSKEQHGELTTVGDSETVVCSVIERSCVERCGLLWQLSAVWCKGDTATVRCTLQHTSQEHTNPYLACISNAAQVEFTNVCDSI
jgi:hypothetical protein